MKLYYSHNLNPRVAVAVARYLQSPLEYVRASPRHPDQIEGFRLINPNALVPVLADSANTLWETDAIACRLSEMVGRPAAPEWVGRTAASSKPFQQIFLPKLRRRSMFVLAPPSRRRSPSRSSVF